MTKLSNDRGPSGTVVLRQAVEGIEFCHTDMRVMLALRP
jgi:hypothetical protein